MGKPWVNSKKKIQNIYVGGDGDGDSSIFRKLKFKTND